MSDYRYLTQKYKKVRVNEKLCINGKMTVLDNPCGNGLIIDTPFETTDTIFECISPLKTAQLSSLIESGININSILRINIDPLVINADPLCNTAFGYHALNSVTSAIGCTAFGYETLLNCTSGFSNTSLGKHAQKDLTTGQNNCAIGDSCMISNLTGSRNTCGGQETWLNFTQGDNNTIIGRDALQGGQNEVSYVYPLDDVGGSLAGTYFLINTPNQNYYLWINIDGISTDPGTTSPQLIGSGRIGIDVFVPMNSNAATIASNSASMINTIAYPVNLLSFITYPPPTYVIPAILIINLVSGNVPDNSDGLSNPTGFNFVISQGVSPGTPNDNCGLGTFVFELLQNGSRNIAIGAEAGYEFIDGSSNVLIGEQPGLTRESFNVAYGFEVNYNNLGGTGCTGFGNNAGIVVYSDFTQVDYDICLGPSAGISPTGDFTVGNNLYKNNICIGHRCSGLSNDNDSEVRYRQDCIMIGSYSCGGNRPPFFPYITYGYYDNCIGIGYDCLTNLCPDPFQVGEDWYILGFGTNTFGGLTAGQFRTSFGTQSGGGDNSVTCGYSATSNTNSVCIGRNAGINTFTSNCVNIGSNACSAPGTSGNSSVLIGYEANYQSINCDNSVLIGNNAVINAGSVVIGHDSQCLIMNPVIVGNNASTSNQNTICLGNNAVSNNSNQIVLTPGFTLATSASAGAGPAEPVNVLGYIEVLIGGNKYGIPVYPN